MLEVPPFGGVVSQPFQERAELNNPSNSRRPSRRRVLLSTCRFRTHATPVPPEPWRWPCGVFVRAEVLESSSRNLEVSLETVQGVGVFFWDGKTCHLSKKWSWLVNLPPWFLALFLRGRYVKGGRLTSHEGKKKNGKTYCCSSNHHGNEQYGPWRTT